MVTFARGRQRLMPFNEAFRYCSTSFRVYRVRQGDKRGIATSTDSLQFLCLAILRVSIRNTKVEP